MTHHEHGACNIPGHDHAHGCRFKRFSWGAVLAGALVGIGLGFLLNLFSIAIGLSFVSNTNAGMSTLAIGGFIGLLIGTIATMLTAGFTAGYLGRFFTWKRNLGVLYGFSAWSLALILSALLAAHMGRYITVYSDFVSHPSATVSIDKHAGQEGAVVNADTEKSSKELGITTFLIFALFFVGALSSCIGGHWGMTCRCDDDDYCVKKE
jgi:hypothetical protein